MKKTIGKCQNCEHQICIVQKEKSVVRKLSNGKVMHSNGKGDWAVCCRVNKCGCMNPRK